jgi:AAA+ superfamily predicted ATPase
MKNTTTSEKAVMMLRAGYSFFYMPSWEIPAHTEALREAIEAYENEGSKPFNCALFDVEENIEPIEALMDLESKKPAGTVLLAKNFQWFLKDSTGELNKAVVSFIQNHAETFSSRKSRKAVIIIGSDSFESAIPACLAKDFAELSFPLPGKEEVKGLFDDILTAAKRNPKFQAPSESETELILANSRGMTRREILNAYAYTIIEGAGQFSPKTVGLIQAREVEKTAGLRIGEYVVSEPLGYDNIKEFVLSTIDSPFAKGLIFLGPAGTGKSMLAKWLAMKSGRKIIELEMAELFGGLIGETEGKWKRAIEVIKANCPCILFADEIEKGLAGAKGGGENDGGTTKRAVAQFLKMLSDNRPEGLYVLATCNDIRQLAPEYVRAERWDTAPFFMDLPNEVERETILNFYKSEFKVAGDLGDTEGWSGAELKSACRIAAMMGKKLEAVKRFVVPISSTMATEIEALRKWSKGKTIPASTAINGNGKKGASERSLNL